MGFFSRTSDILAVNLKDWAERAEEPVVMLRQVIQEIEVAIERLDERTAEAVATERITDRECQRNQAEANKWHSRAEQAIQAGDDMLARKALTRRTEFRKIHEALVDQLATIRASINGLRVRLEALLAKHAEAHRYLATYAARDRAAEHAANRACSCSVELSVDNAAWEQLQRLQSCVERTKIEADVLAALLTDHKRQPTCEEGRDSAQMEVERELVELKSQLKTS